MTVKDRARSTDLAQDRVCAVARSFDSVDRRDVELQLADVTAVGQAHVEQHVHVPERRRVVVAVFGTDLRVRRDVHSELPTHRPV